MPKTKKAKYFVGSNGDAPDQIYFSLDAAKKDEHIYIDLFDKDGEAIRGAIRLVDGEYTDAF